MLNKLTTDVFVKQKAKFIKGVVSLSSIPNNDFKEVCFWGRSNVGKSSLINALIGSKSLVKTSKTPGRTREINYFELANFYLVDLPGYGYAKVSESLKEQWNDFVMSYLLHNAKIKRLYLLIDSKVGFKKLDIEIMQFLNQIPLSYQIILTKVDKAKKDFLSKLYNEVEEQIKNNPACFPKFIITSSKDNNGIKDLQKSIIELINQ